MSNVKHSSKSNLWYTPELIVEKSRRVLGTIDFDPASDEIANKTVKAHLYYSDNSLQLPWKPGSIFCNPPGGKVGNQSQAALFWEKLTNHSRRQDFNHAIFLAFSIEALQTTQKVSGPSICDYMFCVPSSRLKFNGPGESPSHGNLIVYVPGIYDNSAQFIAEFKSIGNIVNKPCPKQENCCW